MAPGFVFPPRGFRQILVESLELSAGPADLWLPLALTPIELGSWWMRHYFNVVVVWDPT